ncbi:MAG: helix-turn-helix domain-containing protein [Colwellia sp.]|nr:helix-turn-helix domain-containing protein [Colwellia sp.]
MNTSLLTPKQTAETLGVTIGTLAVWRCTARYPLPFVKIGRRVMYKSSDVEQYINSHVFNDSLQESLS